MTRLVTTWLKGCGLSHAVPNFTAAGIVTPAALAELDLAHYEALGIKSPDDRRKLFYLIQRIKLAVDKEKQGSSKRERVSIEEQMEKLVSSTAAVQEQPHGESSLEDGSSPLEKSNPVTSGTARKSPSKLQQPKTRSPSSKGSPSISLSSTSPGETTMPIASPTRAISPGESSDIGGSSNCEDVEEDDNADDEASISMSKNNGNVVRRSKRIAEMDRTVPAKTLTTASKTQFTGLKTPISESEPRKMAQMSTQNTVEIVASRSRFQNPSKSLRTGKQLSTIPSDSIAAMSPLPATKLGEVSEKAKANVKENLTSRMQKSGGKPASKGRSRYSLSGSVSESSDSESKGSKCRPIARSRRSLDGSRIGDSTGNYDSDSSSVSSSRRRSSIAPPKTGNRRTSGVGRGQTSSSRLDAVNALRKKQAIGNTSAVSSMTIQANDNEASSWKAQIAKRREEVIMEHELFSADDIINDEEQDNMQIRVAIRKRPFCADKPSDVDVLHPLEFGPYGKMLVFQPKTRVDLTKEIETVPFAFDTVFGEQYDNTDIYNKSVRNLIPVFLEGEHATVFAFGCTGSGKTFTMMGANFTSSRFVEEKNMGLYYMAALDVFRALEQREFSHLSVSVSLFEIYGGKLYDLLHDRKPVKCLEDHKGKVQFPGLSEHRIGGPGDLMEMIELGASARSTGSTSRNADSSRSHAVLQLHLRKTTGRKGDVEHGRLTFIDLAGSERGADTANCSRATRLEGAEINQSLLALKEVIRARARGGSMNHVPFRGSKLTQVLKESFTGERSRCLMIACVSGEQDNCEQTLNTLRYADRVKERKAETGALPAKLKSRGGRRGRSSIIKSSASVSTSSIASKSDLSFTDPSDTRIRKTEVRSKGIQHGGTSQGDDSISDTRIDPTREGRSATASSSKTTPKLEVVRSESFDDDLLDVALNEDNPEALLASALSDDSPEALLSEDSCPVSDSESAQANSLVDELVETHQSFLSAVLGMVQVRRI